MPEHTSRRTRYSASLRCTCSQIDPHEADCALDPRPPPTESDTCPWRWVDALIDLPCEIRRGWHRIGVAGDVLHEFTLSPGAGIKAVEWVDQLVNTTKQPLPAVEPDGTDAPAADGGASDD